VAVWSARSGLRSLGDGAAIGIEAGWALWRAGDATGTRRSSACRFLLSDRAWLRSLCRRPRATPSTASTSAPPASPAASLQARWHPTAGPSALLATDCDPRSFRQRLCRPSPQGSGGVSISRRRGSDHRPVTGSGAVAERVPRGERCTLPISATPAQLPLEGDP